MIIQIVRFKSGLPDHRVLELYEARAPRYRELKGLQQKYYLKFETGEHGAVYVWESKADMETFRESDLGRTISAAYEVQGAPETMTGELVFALRP